MDDPILTTGDAARQLGVSIRTVQVWVETGAISSWRTTGGHRRLRQSDVTALLGTQHGMPHGSGTIHVLAPLDRFAFYRGVEQKLVGSQFLLHDNLASFFLAVGAAVPLAVIFEAVEPGCNVPALMIKAASKRSLAQTRFLWLESHEAARQMVAPYALRGSRISLIHRRGGAQRLIEILAALREAQPSIRKESQDESDFPHPNDEEQRSAALMKSGLLNISAEPMLDELTWLAATALHSPIALITLLATTHQLFKARYGLDVQQTPRSDAFCNRTILCDEPFEIENAEVDVRFRDNPFVCGKPGIRFYAGMRFTDEQGYALGALCVLDREPRRLDVTQRRILMTLASAAQSEIRLRARSQPMGVVA